MASRMESSGIKNKIQISKMTHELVKDYFEFEVREEVKIKGIGITNTYFVLDKIVWTLYNISIIHNICYMQLYSG